MTREHISAIETQKNCIDLIVGRYQQRKTALSLQAEPTP